MKHRILIKRTDAFSKEIEVEAPTPADAINLIESRLNSGGWDEMFSDDGDYEECWYSVRRLDVNDNE